MTSAFCNFLFAIWTRRSSHLKAGLLSVLVVAGLGIASALPTWAQFDHAAQQESQKYESTATFNFSIYEQVPTASFSTPYPSTTETSIDNSEQAWVNDVNQADLKAALSDAAGCELSESDIWIEEGSLRFWSQCEEMVPSELSWQGTAQLSPLLALLTETPMTYLEVSMSMPDIGQVKLTPPGESPYQSEELSWMNRFASDYRVYDIEIANPDVTKITYWYGFTHAQIAREAAGLLLVLVVPIAVMVWLRQRALSAHAKSFGVRSIDVRSIDVKSVDVRRAHPEAQPAEESVPIWFSYQRCTAWLEALTWLAWVTALSLSSASTWKTFFLPPELNQSFVLVLDIVLVLLPAMLLVLLNRCLAFRVMTEVGQLSYSFKEVMLQYVAGQGLFVCLVMIIALFPALLGGTGLAYAGLLLAVIGALICHKVSKKLKDWTPYAITTGELRDRVFALAKPTGVNLKQLYLLPQKRSRMLNACAVKNDTVMVTDYLLKRLSKAEVDGVMAHEIAHLQLGHPKKLLWQLIISGILTLWLMQMLSAVAMLFLPSAVMALSMPLAFAIVAFFFYGTSRKFEYQADAQGVLLTGNPQAAITGLVKLTRFNQMPMQWGKLSESWTTHPSLQRRVSAIAKHHDLPAAEVDALVASAWQASPTETLDTHSVAANGLDEVTLKETSFLEGSTSEGSTSEAKNSEATNEYYDLNTAELSDDQRPIFSSEVQQKLSQRMLLASMGCFTVLPALLGLAVALLPTPGLRWMGYITAALLTIATYAYVRMVGPTWGFKALCQQIAARLQQQGFDISQGTFVGFSPSAELRVYEGCTEWDAGFLVFDQDRLCYVGERVQFAIAADQITQATLTIESPEGSSIGAATITWQAADLTSATYRFQPLSVRSVPQTKAAAQQLLSAIENWQQVPEQNTSSNASCEALQTPSFGAVTSQPFPDFQFSNLVVLWLLQLFIGNLVATIISASGPLRLFIVVMVTVGTILQNLGAIKRTIS